MSDYSKGDRIVFTRPETCVPLGAKGTVIGSHDEGHTTVRFDFKRSSDYIIMNRSLEPLPVLERLDEILDPNPGP